MVEGGDGRDADDVASDAWQWQVASGRVPVGASPIMPYDESVRELVFECWCWLAGRSVDHALRMARDHAGPDVELPDRRTVFRWRRDHDWDGEADRRVGQAAPALRERAALRLLGMLPAAGDRISEAVNAEMRDRGRLSGAVVMAEQQAAWQLVELAGVADLLTGRRIGDDREPDDDLSPLEAVRAARDRILAQRAERQTRKGRRH